MIDFDRLDTPWYTVQFESACLLHFLTSRIKFLAHSHIEQPKKGYKWKSFARRHHAEHT